MGLLDRLSAGQPIAGGEPPTRAWYQWLTKLSSLTRQAYFLATSQIARIEQVNARAEGADLTAERALRLAIARREGELVTEIGLLRRAVVLLQQQNTALHQIAQLREAELQQRTDVGRTITAHQVLRNSNKSWQLEREVNDLQEQADLYGTAAMEDIGTTGNAVPLLSNANTWSASQTIGGAGFNIKLAFFNDNDAAFVFQGAGRSLFVARNGFQDPIGQFIATQTTGSRVVQSSTSFRWGYFTGAVIGSPTAVTDVLTVDSTGITSAGVFKVGASQVVGGRDTGWTAATGTANKGAYAAYAGQTVSAAYVQAEAQAADDATRNNARRIKALEDALRTHGLIGA